jgi:serine/threonine protein kinase
MSTETPGCIGPYAVIARLDRSGEEAVYKVKDGGGRTLAVKLYARGESEDLRGFRLDALAKATRLRHPALVRYEGAGEHEGRVFAAMEFVPATTLLHRKMPFHKILLLMRQMAEGLGYLHLQGVVHGCLNPSRVLVSVAGDIAKITEPGMCPETRPGAMAATATMQVATLARYLAPEMRRAAPYDPDPRTDIYSLGVLFYEVLTGKVPEGRCRLPSQESDEVPPELDEVVLRCLRQDPAARYRTAKELADAIDQARGSLPGRLDLHLETLTSAARGLFGSSRPHSGWRRASWAALGAVALVVALLIVRACS